jgi:hypothetical protein
VNDNVYGKCFYVYGKECVFMGSAKFMGRIIFIGGVRMFMRRRGCV